MSALVISSLSASYQANGWFQPEADTPRIMEYPPQPEAIYSKFLLFQLNENNFQ